MPSCLRCPGSEAPAPASSASSRKARPADLLLVDGDPIANIKLIDAPASSYVVIMKNGKIYKNLLR